MPQCSVLHGCKSLAVRGDDAFRQASRGAGRLLLRTRMLVSTAAWFTAVDSDAWRCHSLAAALKLAQYSTRSRVSASVADILEKITALTT